METRDLTIVMLENRLGEILTITYDHQQVYTGVLEDFYTGTRIKSTVKSYQFCLRSLKEGAFIVWVKLEYEQGLMAKLVL